MSTLSGVMGSLTSSVKSPVSKVGREAKSMVSSVKAATMARVQGTVKQAVNNGVSSVMGGVTKAIETGDPSAVLNSVKGLFGRSDTPAASSTSQYAGAGEGNPLYGLNARGGALLNFDWYATFPSLSSSGGASSAMLSNSNNNVLPWYYCETANLSWRSLETQQVYRRGHQEHLPKGYSIAPLRLGFMLDDTNAALNYLATWQNLILGPFDGSSSTQGLWGRPIDYQKTLSVHMLSVNRQKVLTMTYYGVWPTNLNELSLVSAEGGRLILEVEFSVNDVVYSFGTASSLGGKTGSGILTGAASKALSGSVSSVAGALTKKALGYATSGLSTISPTLAKGASKLLGVK